MKRVTLTLLLAAIIIFSGSRILVSIANYLAVPPESIGVHSLKNKDSYSFYTQSDSDLTLFPWNYNKEDNPTFYDYFLQTAERYDYEFNIDKYINTYDVYEKIHYYFTKTAYFYSKNILYQNTSLYDLLNFDEITHQLTVNDEGIERYYFYENTIHAGNRDYLLSFAMNSSYELLSFQCRQIREADDYTTELFNNGKKILNKLLNSPKQLSLKLLIGDIKNRGNLLTHYEIRSTANEDYFFNVQEEILYYYYQFYVNNKKDQDVFKNNTLLLSGMTLYDSIVNNEDSYTFQMVETENELMVILLDADVVLHFDPVGKMFTGFHLIYP